MVGRFAGAALLAAAIAASVSSAATVVKVDRGVVDVDTNLGYQNVAAAGTGMVLTSSGEVLTNNHVIRGSTTVQVERPGDRAPATPRRSSATTSRRTSPSCN